jgi:hypothetical protein
MRRSKARPAKVSPPAMPAEAGCERSVAETALATAAPEELRDLVLLFATYADGLQHQIRDRNLLISKLIDLGMSLEQVRRGTVKR